MRAKCEEAEVFVQAEAAYQVYARYKDDWPMFLGLVRYYRWFFHQYPIQQVFL
jgi:hypothetical protein